jgi:hypothetical protein
MGVGLIVSQLIAQAETVRERCGLWHRPQIVFGRPNESHTRVQRTGRDVPLVRMERNRGHVPATRAGDAFGCERLSETLSTRVRVDAETPNARPSRWPALSDRLRGIREERHGAHQEPASLDHDQFRLTQATPHVGDLADVTLPGSRVPDDGAAFPVGCAEQPRNGRELGGSSVAHDDRSIRHERRI